MIEAAEDELGRLDKHLAEVRARREEIVAFLEGLRSEQADRLPASDP